MFAAAALQRENRYLKLALAEALETLEALDPRPPRPGTRPVRVAVPYGPNDELTLGTRIGANSTLTVVRLDTGHIIAAPTDTVHLV